MYIINVLLYENNHRDFNARQAPIRVYTRAHRAPPRVAAATAAPLYFHGKFNHRAVFYRALSPAYTRRNLGVSAAFRGGGKAGKRVSRPPVVHNVRLFFSFCFFFFLFSFNAVYNPRRFLRAAAYVHGGNASTSDDHLIRLPVVPDGVAHPKLSLPPRPSRFLIRSVARRSRENPVG